MIGIGPPRFVGTSIEHNADFFVPAAMQELLSPGSDLLRNRRQRAFTIFGRLRPERTLTEANAAFRVLATDLHRQDPAAWTDRAGRARVVTAMPETAARFASEGPGFVIAMFTGLIAGVVALLAIACVNVATVLLARATTRRKEIAVRLAMGASRGRVIRQLLTECALLAAAGGVLGLLIAQSVAALYLRFRPDEAPAFDLTLDYRILLFGIAASLVTVVLFGLAPALQTTRPDVNAELKDTTRPVRVRGLRFNLRSGLVVIQVALSLAFVIGAALMARSSHAGRSEDPGFRREGVFSIGINLSTIPDTRRRPCAFLPGGDARRGRDPRGRSRRAGGTRADGRQQQPDDAADAAGARPRRTSTKSGRATSRSSTFRSRRAASSPTGDRESSPLVAVVNETMAATGLAWRRRGQGLHGRQHQRAVPGRRRRRRSAASIVRRGADPDGLLLRGAAFTAADDAARADVGAAAGHRSRRAEGPPRDRSLGRSHAAGDDDASTSPG